MPILKNFMSSPGCLYLVTAALGIAIGLSPAISHAQGGATGICQIWNGREYVTGPCSGGSAPSGGGGGSYSGGGAAAGALYGGFYSLGYAFGSWLFGGGGEDPNAAAQRQAMMEELRRRQEEAERQRQEEEARRLAEIYNRLAGSLKLSGSPALQLKGGAGGSSGLQLKLGDSAGGGIAGLPGMYLNSGETPYGIQGLPGIYTGGPGQGSGLTASGLQLKTGDNGAAAAQTAAAESTPPSPPPQAQVFNPAVMTPQQLADVAEMFSRLPPEEQARLMNMAQQGTPAAPTATGTVPPAPPPPPDSRPALPSGPPALLQQQVEASQAAATAPVLESASELSREGFDRPLGSAPPVQLESTITTPSVPPLPVPEDYGIDADAWSKGMTTAPR